jgi:predicted AlkP superfamily phosphohydrolase/phosphomutase
MRKKLFFFGVDSATWDLIDPWIKAGLLPGFAKLKAEGTTMPLTSTIPPLTPVAWPTAMTGASPAQHGFYDFYKLDQNHEITLNLASDLPYPFFWDILSASHKKVGIFNLPITYPFKPVNGIMISGLMTPGIDADFIYPKNLRGEFVRQFPHFRFAPHVKVSKEDPKSYELRLAENLADAKETIQIAKWLFAKDDWDLFAVNFMAVDHIQHFFWEFMKQPNSPYRDAILRVYREVDNYLREVLDKHSQAYQIMVFSDHGAGPLEKTLFLNRWLQKKGYLKFQNSPRVWLKRGLAELGFDPQSLIKLASKLHLVRRAGKVSMQKRNRLVNKLVLSYADLDWEKTQAYSFGMYGGIFLTKFNKKLAEEILARFRRDFAPELTFAELSGKLYHTVRYPKTIPDIQFLLKDGAIVSTNIYAFAGKQLLTSPITNKSGEHRMTGILGFYPKVKAKRNNPDLTQITPTILAFFGMQAPAYCQGKSLIEKPDETLEIEEIEI